ncbi:MAG: FAD-dependent monooxygenase [Nannocystaceae bacterium]|nr:FAD-dependent monooxygenase [Myxococcales bacterium]
MTAQVVVVGGGPAGVALAFLLARGGAPVTLLERHVDFAREFRGEGLQPSGVDCIEQMGLGAALKDVPQTRLTRSWFGIRGDVIELPLRFSELEQLRVVSQPHLLARITAAARAYPSFTPRMGATVRDVVRDASGRVCGVRLADGELLQAALVIAADGRHSVIRRRLALAFESIEQGFDVLWSRGELEGRLAMRDGVYGELLPGGGIVTIFPSPAGGHQIGVVLRKGQYKELRASGADVDLGWLRGRVQPELWSMIERARARLCRPVLLDVICGRAAQWAVPGALLIGDAAHPMSPIGGQGINMALRDAIVAANHLSPALRDGAAAIDRATAAVEAERRPEITLIQALQTRRSKGYDRRPSRLTLAVLKRLLRSSTFARLLLRRRAPFSRGIASVELRV